MNVSLPLRSIAFALTLNFVVEASAASIVVAVDGRSGPWSYLAGGLNTDQQYGVGDQLGPVVVSVADGFGFNAGDAITIEYLGGMVSAGDFFQYVDAEGDLGVVTDSYPGSSGEIFPSSYFDPSLYPTYLVGLVGTFTDDAGAIVGDPFSVGLDGTFIVPFGASRLQLGINDDIFGDNTGFFIVRVSGPTAVPEPNGLILGCVAATGGLLVASRRSGPGIGRGLGRGPSLGREL